MLAELTGGRLHASRHRRRDRADHGDGAPAPESDLRQEPDLTTGGARAARPVAVRDGEGAGRIEGPVELVPRRTVRSVVL